MLQEMGEPFGKLRAYGGSPPLPLLIPGVGAQSGCAVATVRTGWRPRAPIIVNSWRATLYPSQAQDFAKAARREVTKARDMLQAALR